MRVVLVLVVLVLVVLGGTAVWIATRTPSAAESAEIAAVLRSAAPDGEPPAYAHCASCHLHDGSGRPDGSIPRLNGQRASVLRHKLHRLRSGTLPVPVMAPFARTLTDAEVEVVAGYLSALPETPGSRDAAEPEELSEGARAYGVHCASCHGAHAEGHDGLFASRLCGQYAAYLSRRLDETRSGARGDADAIMRDVLEEIPLETLDPIVGWLAAGKGCQP